MNTKLPNETDVVVDAISSFIYYEGLSSSYKSYKINSNQIELSINKQCLSVLNRYDCTFDIDDQESVYTFFGIPIKVDPLQNSYFEINYLVK